MRILLVRHGQNMANITREFSYRAVDYSLTDLGREQAEHTGRYFAGLSVDAVASSPLKRAMETAAPIAAAHRLQVHSFEALREVDSGMEGMAGTDENWKLYDEVMDAWLRGEDHVRFVTGGEDFHELAERVLSAVHDMLSVEGGATRVAVSHGGTIMALARTLCPGADIRDLWYTTGLPNCSITEIALQEPYAGQPGELVRFGDNSHIPGAKPGWGH